MYASLAGRRAAGCYNSFADPNTLRTPVPMPIDREQVLHIARLARVGLSEEDVACFQEQLSQILDYFQVLEELDTSEVPPTSHVLPLENVMREDEPSAPMPAEEALANAPQREGDFFKVRAVLEE